MKYYLIEIASGDAKISGAAIYEYSTLDEAKANYHTKIGNAMKSEKYITQMCKVINSVGGSYPELTNFFDKTIKEVNE